jgi:bacterioferritin-associated ferredoxin
MLPDDQLCLCFHVTWRKVINYIRVHRVQVPSQVSECQSSGTGCGWCRKSISRLVQQMKDQPPNASEIESWLVEQYPTSAAYRAGRVKYIAAGHGQPPEQSDPSQNS